MSIKGIYRSKSTRLVLWGMALLACLLLTACGSTPALSPPPQAENGILDARAWNFEQEGALILAGEWEFYWQQLLSPAAWEQEPPHPTGLITLPAPWNAYRVDGAPLAGDGYATYRLTILLDAATAPPLAFKVPEFETAYVLYVNGEAIAANGIVGTTPATMRPQWLPQVAYFSAARDEVQVVLHISNFHHRKGGAGQQILLGAAQHIRDTRERNLYFQSWLFGSLFIMGLYHAVLFAFRRKDPSPLYFGVCCLLMAIRILVTGEYYLSQTLPAPNWELVVKLNYLSFGFTPPVFVTYTHFLFPEVPGWLRRWGRLAAVAFGVVVIVTPARVFTHLLPPYQVLILLVAICVCYALLLAVKHKRPGIGIFLAGFGILLVAMLNDILNSNNVIQTGYFGPFGTWTFVFVQTVFLAQRFSHAFSQVELLSQELEQRVTARTQRLAMVGALGEQLNALLDPDEVLTAVINHTKLRFDYYHVQVFLLDETQACLELARGYGLVGEAMKQQGFCLAVQAPQSLIARSARERRVIIAPDARQEPTWLYHVLLPDTLSEIAAPMMLNDELIGVLDVQQDRIAGLDEGDALLVRSLANQAAVALTNARLFAQAQQRAVELAQAKAWAEERGQAAVEAQRAAEEANRAKSIFLANMSHELRTPLNAVLGFTQLMANDTNLTAVQRENLGVMERSGAHLLALINDVLKITNLEVWRGELPLSGSSLLPSGQPASVKAAYRSVLLEDEVALSALWRAELQEAATQGDMEWMTALAEQIQTAAPHIAQQVRAWIDAFAYTQILEWLKTNN
jgi:putative methionine-R-sulfoxide reductase with GAF domain